MGMFSGIMEKLGFNKSAQQAAAATLSSANPQSAPAGTPQPVAEQQRLQLPDDAGAGSGRTRFLEQALWIVQNRRVVRRILREREDLAHEIAIVRSGSEWRQHRGYGRRQALLD